MDHPAEQSFQEPTDKKTRAGYGKFLRPNTPYDNFMESQGIPIYRDIGVRARAGFAAQAVEAHGRQRHIHSAPRHRRSVGLLRRRSSRRGCAQSRKAPLRRAISRRRRPRHDRSLG